MTPNSDHDILIRIDENMKYLLKNFEEQQKKFEDHIQENKQSFDHHDKRIKTFERIFWMGCGAILIIEVLVKVIPK